MRSEYLKKQIKKYYNEGCYNRNIAKLCDISERTVYRYLKEIREDEDLRIMSPKNKMWKVFCNILCIRLNSHFCDAETLKQSKFVLKEFFPEIDMKNSLDYFRDHGGFCDCEVLMNVENNTRF